jgi:hypothetical protein
VPPRSLAFHFGDHDGAAVSALKTVKFWIAEDAQPLTFA